MRIESKHAGFVRFYREGTDVIALFPAHPTDKPGERDALVLNPGEGYVYEAVDMAYMRTLALAHPSQHAEALRMMERINADSEDVRTMMHPIAA